MAGRPLYAFDSLALAIACPNPGGYLESKYVRNPGTLGCKDTFSFSRSLSISSASANANLRFSLASLGASRWTAGSGFYTYFPSTGNDPTGLGKFPPVFTGSVYVSGEMGVTILPVWDSIRCQRTYAIRLFIARFGWLSNPASLATPVDFVLLFSNDPITFSYGLMPGSWGGGVSVWPPSWFGYWHPSFVSAFLGPNIPMAGDLTGTPHFDGIGLTACSPDAGTSGDIQMVMMPTFTPASGPAATYYNANLGLFAGTMTVTLTST